MHVNDDRYPQQILDQIKKGTTTLLVHVVMV